MTKTSRTTRLGSLSFLSRPALAMGLGLLAVTLLPVDATAQIRAPKRKPKAGTAAAKAPKTSARKAGAADEPPGAAKAPPASMEAIAKKVSTPYRPKGMGHRVKFNLQDADLAELVNHISGMTGKRFIYGAKVRQVKATVVSPSPVTLAEAYQAFLSILEANGMTVVPHGRFLKIVDSNNISAKTTPIYSRGAPVPDTDRFITRLYRLRHVASDDVSTLLSKFKSKEGDISSFGQLLIVTDTGSNIRRMIRLLEEVDVGGAGQKMWIEPVHYGAAADMAKQINEIFDLAGGGGSTGLKKVVADETTNSLIVIGNEDSYLRLLEFMKRLDTAPAAEGKIHVLPLQHAVADELAQTLTQMLSGTAAARAGGGRGRPAAAPAGGSGNAGGMFEGEVRVTADVATNSLIVTSTGRDYAQLRLVIQKLDMPRRQVFIEAVIMDVSVDRRNELGMNFHGGALQQIGGNEDSLIYGGLNPLTTITSPADPSALQGFAVGVRGPELDGTQNILGTGLSIPAFGVLLQAIAQSGDSNVLATPHIVATDNVPAEINIGENIPLQTNFGGGGGGLGGLAGLAGAAGGLGALGGALGGLGGGVSPRQDVGTKIKVTPHINDSDQVRLEIEEEISEPGAAAGTLGAVSITQRRATTTVVVGDQETVVIGGLMRDSELKTRTKIPVLGDLPVLGFLFRRTETQIRKTNLLLILTPHIIRDQRDMRKIFQRKMQERQEFLDRYFVFSDSDWEAPRDWSRTNGLVEDIRQSYIAADEAAELQAQLDKPVKERGHAPSASIDMPDTVQSVKVKSTGKGRVKKKRRPKAKPKRTKPKRRRKKSQLVPGAGDGDPGLRINPVSRSVQVARTE